MARYPNRDTFPKGALYGAAALIGLSITAAAVGRATGIGTFRSSYAPVLESRDLRFEDGQDGAVVVRNAGDGRVVDVIAPRTDHFVRVTLRSLVRARKRDHLGEEQPFRLSRLDDGKLTLEDPATRLRIELDAFGRPNAGAFGAILAAAVATD